MKTPDFFIPGKIYYLATPYSDPNYDIVRLRYQQTEEYYFTLLSKGIFTYSPIIHNHHIAGRFKLPKDYNFWKGNDNAYIKKLDGVIVALMPEWDKSKGVKEEINLAKSLNKPICYYRLFQQFKNEPY